MSEELRECPFCNGKAEIAVKGEYTNYISCSNPDCNSGAVLPAEKWQSRPGEYKLTSVIGSMRDELDILRAQLAEAKEALEKITNNPANDTESMVKIADKALQQIKEA